METIKLDLIPGKKMPSLHASQYDDGREHGIDLFENGIAYKLDGTETLTINERKVDNNICSMDIENTFTGSSHIEFASFLQMCACAGSNFCELRISKGGVDIGTLNFILEVEPDPTADGIESTSEIRNLKRQIEAITEEVIGDDYYTAEQTDEAIATATEGKADTTYVDEQLNNKMDKANPTGTGSFSLNRKAETIIGQRSFAEGYNNEASGNNSHAECRSTTASGNNSHSEGNGTTASGDSSHAEGQNATASGIRSHAEGHSTTASGSNSHSEGLYTIANHKSQHVFGEYNIPDDSTALPTAKGNYTEIVGNGTSVNNRSNARTLDWQGNETLAGDLTYNGNKSLTSEISRLDGKINTKANASDVYTKSQTDNLLNDKADVSDLPDMSQYYDKSEVDDLLDDKANSDDVYGKAYIDTALSGKANVGTSYTKSEEDALLANKADKSDTYTKEQVDDIVYGILPDDTASGSVANFTTSLELPIKSIEVDVNAVQSAGTPTPATPLPISGWSEITLVHCGANLFDGHLVNGIIDSSSGAVTPNNNNFASENFISVKENTTIVFVCSAKSSGDRFGRAFYDKNQNYISGSYVVDYQTPITVPSGAYYMKFFVPKSWYGSTASNNISINYPSSDTTYHAYNPNANTEVINLGGTYYGGHFTQDKAGHRQFVVTSRIVTLDASKNWAKNNAITASNAYTCGEQFPDYKRENGLCSHFEVVSSVSATSGIFFSGGVNILTPLDMGLDNADKFKEWIASNNVQVVYSITEPIVIDLPDGEPIITLNGTNNIYADTGDSTVVFKCSVNDYINAHQSSGAKSLGGVFLGGSNSGSEEPTEKSEEPTEELKEVTKTLGDEPISKK